MGFAPSGFRGRLLAGAVLPALLMVILVGMVFLSHYRSDMERSFLERGKAIARQLGSAAEYALFSDSRDTLAMLAEGARQGDPAVVAVSVLDRQGRMLVHSGAPLPLHHALPLVPTLQLANGGELVTIQMPIQQAILPIASEETDWHGADQALQPDVTGYLVVEISRAELTARMREMLQITLAIMLGGLLLAGWLSLRIASGVLASLDAASQALHRQKEAAEALARTDPLTGLANRRAFDEAARLEVQRALRYGTPLALVLADLDHFKSINDSFGHHSGDEVLRHCARILSATVRNVDLVGRWGGEEFVILMPDTGLVEAVQAAERFRQAIAGTPVPLGERSCQCTASFGVAALQRGTADLEALLNRADAALYRAKERGRDRVEAG